MSLSRVGPTLPPQRFGLRNTRQAMAVREMNRYCNATDRYLPDM